MIEAKNCARVKKLSYLIVMRLEPHDNKTNEIEARASRGISNMK
jgi:hypothetical protein